MKLEKVINYEFNRTELENKIKELESKVYKTETDNNLIRKYKSELEEIHILKHLNNKSSIKRMKYVRDYTEKSKNKEDMDIEELIENETNKEGVDLYVQTTSNKLIKVDMKVLEYDPLHRKLNKVMNGKLTDDRYRMENFIFQVEGMWGRNGWANERYKRTDMLMIYIPQVKCLYEFDYKKLVEWLSNKINSKEITEKDYIPFGKYWDSYRRRYSTRECIVSISCSEIPSDVLVDIHKL